MDDDPFEEVVEELVNAREPVCLTAAAGCGKTEAIARAVAQSEGKQLVLTHTNAGVAALRSRLRRYSVPESKYRVETIASWLLKYAIAYSSMSGQTNPRPMGADWAQVYLAAQKLFDYPFVKDVLQASYTGIFVDEYQDCTQKQHAIILKLCEYLPVRVLGDPLQGIFGFDDPLVDWQTDVLNQFSPLPDLLIPYRWQKPGANPQLGENLIEIRKKLLAGEQIDLSGYSQVNWHQWSEQKERAVCESATSRGGTIAGIHQWPSDAHGTARRIGGKYQSMEEMDCRALMNTAREVDQRLANGNYKAVVSSMKNFILKGCGNRSPFKENSLQVEFTELGQGNLSVIADIMEKVIRNPAMQVYRRELFTEMKRAAQEFATETPTSFEEAAYVARYRTRVNGRKPGNRIISRTLLIKGLEFDHAIVLNADKLQNRENLYVAITRGSQSLTVLSSSPVIHYSQSSRC